MGYNYYNSNGKKTGYSSKGLFGTTNYYGSEEGLFWHGHLGKQGLLRKRRTQEELYRNGSLWQQVQVWS